MSDSRDWSTAKASSSQIEYADAVEKGAIDEDIAQTVVPADTQRQIRRQVRRQSASNALVGASLTVLLLCSSTNGFYLSSVYCMFCLISTAEISGTQRQQEHRKHCT